MSFPTVFVRQGRQWVSRCMHSKAQIVEVGARDGLQNEPNPVSVAARVTLIQRLVEAGVTRLEAGSFVSSKYVPTMASTDTVMSMISETRKQHPNVKVSCLVPTLRYMQEALPSRPDEVAIFASASESFSQKNINASIDESIERFRDVVKLSQENGIRVRGYVSCVIACPYEGPIEPRQVGRVTEKLLELGCSEVSLGDTIGIGTVNSTKAMLEASLLAAGGDCSKLAVHFHDTYGQALPNILTSLEAGINVIDSSVAGLGGCPYARGATGNVATEDVVYMLHGLGEDTGINLDKLVDAGEYIVDVLGRQNGSKTARAILAKRKSN